MSLRETAQQDTGNWEQLIVAQWAHKLVLRLIFRTFRCGGHHIDVDWNGCEANSVLLHVLAVANFGENKPFKCMFFLSHS